MTKERTQPERENPYRLLPSVDEVLQDPEVASRLDVVGRELGLGLLQETLDAWRGEIRAGELDAAGLRERLADGGLRRALARRLLKDHKSGMTRLVNATGVILNTGLGRAPVHPEAAAAMEAAARSYVVLEVERFSGARNRRDDRLSVLLSRLTGAEAGIAVNNNAAAVVLTLSTFAAGKNVVVSRGELVEIGGSFRLPDVMERAGVHLAAVGTTNRTRIGDYREAAGGAGLLLKVHTSNYRVVGFTEEVGEAELAALGHELSIPTALDLGSGLLEPARATPLAGRLGQEPLVLDAVETGVDVVMFSGDKLLGGPQAGLLVGKREAIERLRKNPLYRALRLDKVAIAGLERTCELYLEGRGDEIPSRARMIAGESELELDAERVALNLRALDAGFETEVVVTEAQPGSGSAPTVTLPSRGVAVSHPELGPDQLAARLRAAEPPVFARITDGKLLLDMRTLLSGDVERLTRAFAQTQLTDEQADFLDATRGSKARWD
ncbi:MAG: L-seryl-tRNA(Sec) selenium transferase [Planctomycetota bacterium]